MPRAIVAAKIIVIVCMAMLLLTTYMLRSRVLNMVGQYINAENIVAEEQMSRFTSSSKERQQAYEAGLVRYQVQVQRYRDLLDMYENDFETYQQQMRDGRPPMAPPVPTRPNPPRTPEVQEQLAKTHTQFRKTRDSYFATARTLNLLVGLCAIGLIGGILFLIMFDANQPRFAYLVVLVISFVFVVGPALHSAMTFMAYSMRPPPYIESPTSPYMDPYRQNY
ncbi:MAG: hypothetical protein AAGC44_14755 [Planctomycetota bacterium]